MAESKKKTVAAKTVKTETAAPAEVKADAVETKEEVKTAVKKETKTATKKAPAKKTTLWHSSLPQQQRKRRQRKQRARSRRQQKQIQQ